MKINCNLKRLTLIALGFFLMAGCANMSPGEYEYEQKAIDATGVSEVEFTSTKTDIKLEKSKDEKLYYFYYKNKNCEDKSIESKDGPRIKLDFSKIDAPAIFNNIFNENCGIVSEKAKATIRVPAFIKKIIIDTASGDIKISEVESDSMNLESVSADIELKGRAKEIKLKTVSGDIKFQSDISDPNVKASTVSGDVKITFNEMPDINLQFSTISGDADFDKSFSNTEIDGSVKNLKFGKGSGEIEIHTVSGDAKILKSER